MGRRSLTPSLGSLFCRNSSGRPVHLEVVVAGQRGAGVGRGAEAVHEDERQGGAVLPAQVQHLPGDHVEEGEPPAHAEQRLGAGHAHRGAEPTVELDHHGVPDGRGGGLVVDLDVGDRLHVERVDRVLGDHAGLAALDQPVVVREDVDRHRIHAGGLHLLARLPQSFRVHASIVGLLCAGVHGGRKTGPSRPAARCPSTPAPRRHRRARPAARGPPARGSRDPPCGHRRRLRLRLQRARHRPAARGPARRRQAGDPAGPAARQRPRLGGVRRPGSTCARRDADCSSPTARCSGPTRWPRPTRCSCRAWPWGATGCAWVVGAGPTTGCWGGSRSGTFVCVLLNSEEVLDSVPREDHDRPVSAVATENGILRSSAVERAGRRSLAAFGSSTSRSSPAFWTASRPNGPRQGLALGPRAGSGRGSARRPRGRRRRSG